MSEELKGLLNGLAQGAQLLSVAPGPVGIVARIVSIAASAAAAFAHAGKDPEIEIKRIFSADPKVKEVHDEWERLIKEKFLSKSAPPQPPDTVPDPYEP